MASVNAFVILLSLSIVAADGRTAFFPVRLAPHTDPNTVRGG
jgi:hypothetical protein